MNKSARALKLSASDLAKLIKANEVGEDAYTELWLLLQGLTYKLSYSFYTRHESRCRQCGVTLEDLRQEAYIAMLNALNAYSIDCEYEFGTYYGWHCKNLFYKVTALDSKKHLNDPGLNSVSLSTLIGDDTELEELRTDETAEKAFDAVIERGFQLASRA